MSHKIAIIGTGYIGLVTGICLADLGNSVTCIDIDKGKIEKLKKGESPIFEPGLENLMQKVHSRLKFTTSYAEGVKDADLVFIAVNTPSLPNGEANLKYVFAAAQEIGRTIDKDVVIVNKSTVPVGTGHKVEKVIQKETNKKVSVISCPEFLREGMAIHDFFHPYRVVIGADPGHEKAVDTLKELFEKVVNSHSEYVITDLRSAEMIKYASNSFLATQISFINELAKLCEKVGVDVTEVARGMKLDERIGKDAFLSAGLGYGGSCFPKDVRALIALGKKQSARLGILEDTEKVNERQVEYSFSKIKKLLRAKNVNLSNARIGILGISFKPNTDDTRESQSIKLMQYLIDKGAKDIRVCDPQVNWADLAVARGMTSVRGIDEDKVGNSILKVADKADILVLVTEWEAFSDLDFEKLGEVMKNRCFVDLRNVYCKAEVEKYFFEVENVGRK